MLKGEDVNPERNLEQQREAANQFQPQREAREKVNTV